MIWYFLGYDSTATGCYYITKITVARKWIGAMVEILKGSLDKPCFFKEAENLMFEFYYPYYEPSVDAE